METKNKCAKRPFLLLLFSVATCHFPENTKQNEQISQLNCCSTIVRNILFISNVQCFFFMHFFSYILFYYYLCVK